MKLQIKDWNTHFENDRSRQRAKCSFVCVPNKQHGMGFCRIMAEPDGAAIYGIWHLILGACSQQTKRDGWLTADGEQAGSPWGVGDLALKFRRPEKEIERAIQVLTSEKVGWITNHQVTADSPRTNLEEKEVNRREGIEGKGSGSLAPSFSESPSWQEFWDYCNTQECLLPAEWFARDKFDAAEAANWERNRNWKAYARRCKGWWEQDGRPMQPNRKGKPIPEAGQIQEVINVPSL